MAEQNETPDPEKSPQERHRIWNMIHKDWALTVIVCGFVLILIAAIFVESSEIGHFLTVAFNAFEPIIIGIAIAFVLYKPEIGLERLYGKCRKKFPRFPVMAFSILTSYICLILIVILLIRIIWPQFVSSILDFGNNILVYYNNFIDVLNSDRGKNIMDFLTENGFDVAEIRSKLVDFSSYLPTIVSAVTSWASGMIGGLFDLLIGLFFSIYVLANHKTLKRQIKRISKHFLSTSHYRSFRHYSTMTFQIFSDYISGILIDSIIVGVVTFIVISIFGIEYPLMIATVVGVTNIIPVVGPFIGAIPCALILLTVNPVHAVIFVIIILVIQQLDGHILKAYIFGNAVGLPSIWVLFSIIVGGALFGAYGMLLGVPIMSVIYAVIRDKTADSAEPGDTPKPKRQLHPIRDTLHLIRRVQHRNRNS